MPNELVVFAVPAGVILALGLFGFLLWRRTAPTPFEPTNEREDQLARRLARMVGCDPADALPAVRKELTIAPDQTDETLLKRAAYHYRQEQPDKPCAVWRDRRAG